VGQETLHQLPHPKVTTVALEVTAAELMRLAVVAAALVQ
jgi:hypothetical protein